MVGNTQLKVAGISGLSVKWDRQARIWWTDLREKIGKGEYQITNHGIDWILLEERLIPSKGDIYGIVSREECFVKGGEIGNIGYLKYTIKDM